MVDVINVETTFDHSARLITDAMGFTDAEWEKSAEIFAAAAEKNAGFDTVVSTIASSDLSDLVMVASCVKAGECANPLKNYNPGSELQALAREIAADEPGTTSKVVEAVISHANGKLSRDDTAKLAFAASMETQKACMGPLMGLMDELPF